MGAEPRFWRDALLPEGVKVEAVERLQNSPRLSDAVRHSVNAGLSLRDNMSVFYRNLADIGRFMLGVVVLYLDATGGVTHRRLRELAGGSGIVSSGRATAVLWQLRRIGYVTAETDRSESRIRRYAPTQEMRRVFNARFRIDLEAVAGIDPAMRSALDRFDEPEFNRAFWAEVGRNAMGAIGHPLHAAFPLTQYSQHNTSMVILFALLADRNSSGPFPSPGVVSLSISALSKRFEVSRTHVRRLIEELTEGGYYEPYGDGIGNITQKLCDDLRLYFTYVYIRLGASAEAALETCDALTARAAQ